MGKYFFKFRFLGIVVLLAMIAVFSVAAMLLWNWLMPGIFGLPALNYRQTAGILILARILFGGLGGGHFMPHGRRGFGALGSMYGNKLREKWMNMTEEERKAFAEKEKAFHRHFHDRFSSRFNQFDGAGAASPKGDGNE
jgi:ABC-type multidrug transport system fused ATPase/permease subunit